MPVCIVKGCATTSKTKPYDILLHSFPKEKVLIKRWLQQMHQDLGDLEELAEKVFTSARGNYRMCSLHFTRDAYEKRGYSTFLKRDAIPTVFPKPAAIQPPAKKSSAALTSELHTGDASSTTDVQSPIRQPVVGSCQYSMASPIEIKTEDETSSSCLFSTESHRVPAMPTAAPLPPKQETVVGLSPPEPVMASQTHIKTEDETSSTSELDTVHIAPLTKVQLSKQDMVEGAIQHNLKSELPHTHIKSEAGTLDTTIATELHAVYSVPPTNIIPLEQEMEVGINQNKTGIPLKIHIKTEDETSGDFITTEIKTVHFMPSTGQLQESTSARPQKRKRLCAPRSIKTIGTVTGYFPGQVHKSIQFDRSMGAKHRSFQVRLRPFHNSVGIQCNLVKLPSLKTIARSQTETVTESEKATQDLPITLGQTPSREQLNSDPT
ncbi:U4/U6 small nuclear ribonucleoprotein Prp4 isoform X2 [Aquarana catesbeiana]